MLNDNLNRDQLMRKIIQIFYISSTKPVEYPLNGNIIENA